MAVCNYIHIHTSVGTQSAIRGHDETPAGPSGFHRGSVGVSSPDGNPMEPRWDPDSHGSRSAVPPPPHLHTLSLSPPNHVPPLYAFGIARMSKAGVPSSRLMDTQFTVAGS